MRRGVLAAILAMSWAVVASADLPSDFYSTKTKTATASTNQTDTTIWTPASGKRLILQGAIFCATDASDNVELEEDDGTDVLPPFAIESYGCKSFSAGGAALWMGDPDEYLTYTARGSGTISVTLWGYEIQ